MNTYQCYRCGKLFGSPAAVVLHLNREHDDVEMCDRCGREVKTSKLMAHTKKHQLKRRQSTTESTKAVVNIRKIEKVQSWEPIESRLLHFFIPDYFLICRMCGKRLADNHGREQHEQAQHRFTQYTRESMCIRLTPDHFSDCEMALVDYVRRHVAPVVCGGAKCNAEVNKLVDFMMNQLPFDVTHAVRGGSFGKSSCLHGHSDLDLVIFVKNDRVTTIGQHARLLPSYLEAIKKCILGSIISTRIMLIESTKLALRFQYKCYKNEHFHHVDVLPALDLLGMNPTQGDKNAVYRSIASCNNLTHMQLYTASLMTLQVDFVRRRSGRVRDLIRMVRLWRRTTFNHFTPKARYRRLPNSYILELITINAWEKAGKPVSFQILIGMTSVLKQLVNYRNLCVFWDENYSKKSIWIKRVLAKPRPIVIDPANPVHNLCESYNAWDEFAHAARHTLKKPMFKEVTCIQDWN